MGKRCIAKRQLSKLLCKAVRLVTSTIDEPHETV
jgi:hypothetical protein